MMRYRPRALRSGGRGWGDAGGVTPAEDGDFIADMGIGPRAARFGKPSDKHVLWPVVNCAAKYKLGSNFAA
jgi:hypothetical protein